MKARARAVEPRCEMTGRYAADWWKHTNKRGNYDARRRCLNVATIETGAHQRMCAACRKHNVELSRAEMRIAKLRLETLRTAKRIRRTA